MRMSRAAGVAAAFLAQLAPVPVDAAQLRVCTGSAVWTFSPPLSLQNNTGTISVTWSGSCVKQTVDPSGPGQSTSVEPSSGSFTVSYTGNCVIALISGHFVGTLAGGTTLVVVNSDGSEEQDVLVPDEVCNERTATSTGKATYLSL